MLNFLNRNKFPLTVGTVGAVIMGTLLLGEFHPAMVVWAFLGACGGVKLSEYFMEKK
jgi:uncharacterized membrane protein